MVRRFLHTNFRDPVQSNVYTFNLIKPAAFNTRIQPISAHGKVNLDKSAELMSDFFVELN